MSILRPGGVIVVFDKLVPPGGYPATVQARLTRSSKLEQDAEPGAEGRKKLSLSDIQRPLYPGVPDEYTVKDEKRRFFVSVLTRRTRPSVASIYKCRIKPF